MERKFAIVTDSGCDMPEDYLKEHNVETVNFGFLMDNILYSGEDGKKIEVKEFYNCLRKGAMPITHQVNSENARIHLEKYLQQGLDVLVINFSSALSGTINSFRLAAKGLKEKYPEREILVNDSLCASMGEGLYLDYAIKKADAGASLQETYDYLEEMKQHICHMFTVDNLFHLKRGGRVSATTAVVGTLLAIKPIMHMDEAGKLTVIGKVMGRKKSIKTIFENMKAMQILGKEDPVFIVHGDCEEDANLLADMVRREFPEQEIRINYIGPSIGAHSGPGTLALFFNSKCR